MCLTACGICRYIRWRRTAVWTVHNLKSMRLVHSLSSLSTMNCWMELCVYRPSDFSNHCRTECPYMLHRCEKAVWLYCDDIPCSSGRTFAFSPWFGFGVCDVDLAGISCDFRVSNCWRGKVCQNREALSLTKTLSPWATALAYRWPLDDIVTMSLEALAGGNFFTLDDRCALLFNLVIRDSNRMQGLLQLRFIPTAWGILQVAR